MDTPRSWRHTLWAAALLLALPVGAADWTAFRGGSAAGISTARPPERWSDAENLRWKTALPGPGGSSPVVLGNRVFVTCYSGYGENRENPGDPRGLKRHLLCVERGTGRVLWQRTVASEQAEDPYSGYLTEHGYASNTPVTDGERVYVFFGKSGVLAYDLEGKELWRAGVGTSSASRRWGSASSLALYKDLLLVNASEESRSLRALDRRTGREVWKAEGEALELAYGTPTPVTLPDGRTELVIAAVGEVWGLNPETGKLTWFARVPLAGNVCPTVVAHEGVVFVTGGFQQRGTLAVRAGGKGDVTATHLLWQSRPYSYVPTPVYHQGHLYWVSEQGVAVCLRADTGQTVYEERLRVPNDVRPRFYASVVLADGKLYAVSRNAGTFVLAAAPQFQQLQQNLLSDPSTFNGTPAPSDRQLFLRSDRFLYCVEAPR